MWLTIFGIISLSLWYVVYGLEVASGDGRLGRHRYLYPFQCLWSELLWNLPGGRAQHIRDSIVADEHSAFGGKTKLWYGSDIVAKNQYAACGRDMLPGRLHFLFFTLWLLWPVGAIFHQIFV